MTVKIICAFNPYECHMGLCSESCLSGWLAGLSVLYGKNCDIGHYMKTVQPNLFIVSMLIGTIDFCHLIPLLLTWTLPGGHKISTKQNLLASFSHTLFIWWGWNWMWWWSNSGWTSWDYFWVRFCRTRDTTSVLLIASKNINILMYLDIYESIWFKPGMMIGTYSTFWY